jgi:hypothetical protein
MAAVRNSHEQGRTGNVPKHWDMISGFVLSLLEAQQDEKGHLLEPVVSALEPLGLGESLLSEISNAIVQAGAEMRGICPEGKLICVNVRVNVSSQALQRPANRSKPWIYYIVKQITSSESDNLNALDEPCCYIDLHVYQEM